MTVLAPVEEPQEPPPRPTLAETVRITAPVEQDPPPPDVDPVADVIRLQGLQRDQALMFNFSRAIEADPELAGEAQRLGIETGLDPLLIEQNIDQVRQLQKRTQFENFELDRMTPALRAQLESDPSFARIAHDDLDNLSLFEELAGLFVETPGELFVLAKLGLSLNFGNTRIGFDLTEDQLEQVNEVMGRRETGILQAQRGAVGSAGALDALRGLDFKGQAVLDRMNADLALLPQTSPGFISGLFNMAGQLQVTLPVVAGTAALGAGVGSVVPGLGTVAGAGAAGIGAIVSTSAIIEGGNQFLDLIEQGVDPVLAAKIALPVGAISGVLEAVGFGLLAKPAKDVIRRRITKAAIEQLTKQTTTAAVLKAATSVGGAVGGEVVTEVAQELTQMAGDTVAGVGPEDAGEVWERISAIIVETIASTAILGSIGPAVGLTQDLRMKTAAEKNHEALERLMDQAGETKALQRSASTTERFFRATLRGDPAKTVYLDGAQLVETLDQENIRVGDVERVMPGFAAKLERAVKDGGDVVIPIAEYVAKFSRTKFEPILRQDVRLNSADAPSARDLLESEKDPELQKEVKAVVEEALSARQEFDASAKVVGDRILAEIQAVGLLPKEQERVAAFLYRQIIGAQAVREQVTPEQFDARNQLGVSPEPLPPPEGEVVEQPPKERPEPFMERLAKMTIEEQVDLFNKRGLDQLLQEAEAEAAAAKETEAAQQEEGELGIEEEELLQQGPRGGFRRSDLTIELNKDSDFSTWIHELGHYYMTVLLKQALDPNASGGVRADAEALMEWFGIDSLQTWDAMSVKQQKTHHEAFASNLEIYYFEGKAPSTALEKVFQKIRTWMINVYQVFTTAELRAKLSEKFKEQFGVDLPEMNDKVRDVFDRMLAAQEAINLTEAARAMLPMFQTQEQSGMSDTRWATYQRAADDYHEDALTLLMTRSLKAMQWLSGQTQGKLAELQREHDKVRRETRKEVEALVDHEPVYQAIKFLQTGRARNADGTLADPEQGHRMDTDRARALLPTAFIPTAPGVPGPKASLDRLRGMTKPDGVDPDIVARMFGFTSGEEMIRAIVRARPRDDVISDLTDQRMEAEHSDLINPRQLQAAVEEALHNPARARFVAAEWRALAGAPGSLRDITRAARQAARDALAQLPVESINPRDFSGAEQRHRKEAEKASKAGDTPAAIVAKRKEMLQHMMAAEAVKVQKEIGRVLDVRTNRLRGKLRKVLGKEKKIAATRDIDLVRAVRVALVAVGAARPLETSQEKELTDTALAKVREDHPVLADGIQGIVARNAGTPIQSLNLEQFRNLVQVVESGWDLALTVRSMVVEGRRVEIAEVKQSLMDAVSALPAREADKFGAKLTEGKTPTETARFISKGWHVLSALKRFQHYALFLDGKNPNGAWQTFALRPMVEGIDQLLSMKLEMSRRFSDEVARVEKASGVMWDTEIQARADELPNPDKPNEGFVFRGMRELIDVMLDMGNPSNLAKRLVGEGWAPNPRDTDGQLDTTGWDRFLSRMFDEGIVTQAHLDFLQYVWGEFRTLLPLAQETQRQIYGFEFKQVEIGNITLPSGEVVLGGYVPLRIDHDRSRNPRTRQFGAIESLDGLEMEYQYSNQSVLPGRGFTLERNPNFYDRLHMDIARRWLSIDEELRFIFIMPAARRLKNIVLDPEVGAVLQAYDPEMVRRIILPWLRASARQIVSEPGANEGVDIFFRFLRRGTGVAFLGMNVTTALVQLTGVVNSMTMVKKRYFYQGWLKVAKGPLAAWQEAMKDNPRMADRFSGHGQRMQDFITRRGKSKVRRGLQVTQQEGARVAMFALRFLQSNVDVITWHGMRFQVLAGQPAGMDMNLAEKQARARANEAVERSQGSARPESLAAFEVGTPFIRSMVQFLNYSNGVLNQWLGERTALRRLGKFALMLVAISFIETIFRSAVLGDFGGGEDEDGNGPLERFADRLVRNAGRNAAGQAPFLGPALLNLMKDEGDRLSTTPSASALATAYRGVVGLLEGELRTKDLGIAATILSGGIPIMALTDRLDYIQKVNSGEIDPTSELDFLRGIFTGRPSQASRR